MFQFFLDGSRIVLIEETELQHFSAGCFLTSADSLTESEKNEVARSLADGLANLHSNQIYLGNGIKPQNIFVLQSATTGCHAVFVARHETSDSGSEEVHIIKLADILEFVWTSGQVRLTFAQDALLSDMRNRFPGRLSMNEISKHVAFWPKEKALGFFIAVSEVLELKQRRHRESVEENGHKVIGDSWHDTLDPVVRGLVEQGRRRSYEPTSVADLLRLIRNLACHYYNFPPAVRASLGPFDSLGSMWTGLFPRLLLHTFAAMEPFKNDTNCKRVEKFYL